MKSNIDRLWIHTNSSGFCDGPVEDYDNDGIGLCHKCWKVITATDLISATIPDNFSSED